MIVIGVGQTCWTAWRNAIHAGNVWNM